MTTHTYVELDLSAAAYDEIRQKLQAAGYDHAFGIDGAIDMHGIGVIKEVAVPVATDSIVRPDDFKGHTFLGVIHDVSGIGWGYTIYRSTDERQDNYSIEEVVAGRACYDWTQPQAHAALLSAVVELVGDLIRLDISGPQRSHSPLSFTVPFSKLVA